MSSNNKKNTQKVPIQQHQNVSSVLRPPSVPPRASNSDTTTTTTTATSVWGIAGKKSFVQILQTQSSASGQQNSTVTASSSSSSFSGKLITPPTPAKQIFEENDLLSPRVRGWNPFPRDSRSSSTSNTSVSDSHSISSGSPSPRNIEIKFSTPEKPKTGFGSPSAKIAAASVELTEDEYSKPPSTSTSTLSIQKSLITEETTFYNNKSRNSIRSRNSNHSIVSTYSVVRDYNFCQRPDKGGDLGVPVLLKTNFYPIEIDFDKIINHFDVLIQYSYKDKEGVENFKNAKKEFNNEIIESVFRENKLGNYVYDGEKNVYSVRDITLTERKFTCLKEDKRYDVKLKLVASVMLSKMKDHINGLPDIPKPEINLLNLAIRQNKLATHKLEKHSTFSLDKNNTYEIDYKLCFAIGQYLSIKPCQAGWLQNSDMDSAVFYKDVCLHELAKSFIRDPKHPQKLELNLFEREIKGLWVEQIFTLMKFKIDEISTKTPIEERFEFLDQFNHKVSGSVENYFREKYKYELKFPDLPLIVIKKFNGQQILLPMEICRVVKGQRYKKSLTPEQQAKMGKGTVLKPSERANKINDLMMRNQQQPLFLREFGVTRCDSSQMINVQARVLSKPQVFYHRRDSPTRWNLKYGLSDTKQLTNWKIIVLTKPDSRSCRIVIENQNLLLDTFVNTFKEGGIAATRPPFIHSDDQIERIFNTLKPKDHRDHPQLVIFIIQSSEQRDVIKYLSESQEKQMGIMTQCLKADKLAKFISRDSNDLKSYITNVFLKVNVKLGGTNGIIYFKTLGLKNIDMDSTMIFGADVTHQVGDSISIAAVVGSTNKTLTHYMAQLSEQTHEKSNRKSKEIIVNLKEMVLTLLRAYRKKNDGHLPNHVIFYRDGVDEGQFENVVSKEINDLRKAYSELLAEYSPKTTFIIVQKRHHIRFFPITQTDKNRDSNIQSGTVIDSHITSKYNFDFFLCSHETSQGTSQPVRYWVIYDENQLDSNTIQTLTYSLCHLYAKTTKPVSIPASVYYAHLAAFRGRSYRQHLNKQRKQSQTLEISKSTLNASLSNTKTENVKLHSDIEPTMFYT